MDKPPVIVVGQTPPPFEGQAIMIAAMIEGLRDRVEIVPVRMAFSASAAEAGAFAWKKVAHLFSLIRRARAALRRHPEAILYYPPAPARPLAVLRDILLLTAVRGRARTTVFHFHAAGLADYLRRHAWARAAGRRAYGQPDAAIVQTDEGRADGEALGARRVEVIPCGRDVPLFRRSRENGPFRIFFAGIHRRSKGILDAIETLARLRGRGIDAELRTAGAWFSTADRTEAARRVAALGLSERVVFCGVLTGDALWREYAEADAFFFPTFYEWESLGVVLLEAMAYGLPVVASDWRGPRDVVVRGETGFVCPVGDIEAYAGALERLAREPDLRARMGAAGRRRYEERYTLSRFLDGMERLFRSVAGGGGRENPRR
mgnify:CR=1 FL=1